uniref:Si:ch211-194k22.8 n=1 Tax=Oncorhynchus tshawytscha TaxID=74940 RepID=A0A8C8IGA0_ONCTS
MFRTFCVDDSTACGELSRNLKALIEKTQRWSNEDSKTSVQASRPSLTVGLVSGDAMTPDLLACPTGMNGQWEKQGALPQKLHRERRFGPASFELVVSPQVLHIHILFCPQFITPELLERCNTGTTAQKLTNDLLRGLYERDCLASHSISGLVYHKRSQTKPALPTEEVQAILRTVQYFFPGKTDVEIKGYIRQKLQNEAKRLMKKPPLLGNMDSSFDLPCPRT